MYSHNLICAEAFCGKKPKKMQPTDIVAHAGHEAGSSHAEQPHATQTQPAPGEEKLTSTGTISRVAKSARAPLSPGKRRPRKKNRVSEVSIALTWLCIEI